MSAAFASTDWSAESSLASTRVEANPGMPAGFDAIAASFKHLLEQEIAPLLKCRNKEELERILGQVGSRMTYFRQVWLAVLRDSLAVVNREQHADRVSVEVAASVFEAIESSPNFEKVLGDWAPKHAVQLRIFDRRNRELVRFSELELPIASADAARLLALISRGEIIVYALMTAVDRGRRLPAPVAELLVQELEETFLRTGKYIAPLRRAARSRLPARTPEPEPTDAEAADRESLAELGLEEWAAGLTAAEGKAPARRGVGAGSRQGARRVAGH